MLPQQKNQSNLFIFLVSVLVSFYSQASSMSSMRILRMLSYHGQIRVKERGRKKRSGKTLEREIKMMKMVRIVMIRVLPLLPHPLRRNLPRNPHSVSP